MAPQQMKELLSTALFAQWIYIALLAVVFFIFLIACGFNRAALGHTAGILAVGALLGGVIFSLMVLTREVSANSAPVLRLPNGATFSGLLSVRTGLWADLIAAYILIRITGGSLRSSYGPLLFLLPTLAILLMQHERQFLYDFVLGTSAVFLAGLLRPSNRFFERERIIRGESRYDRDTTEIYTWEGVESANQFATVVLTLLCFWLSFYIGQETATLPAPKSSAQASAPAESAN